ELRHREPVEAVDARGVAEGGQVEPPGAARSASDRPELATRLAELLAHGVGELGGERPFADAGRVALGDADDAPDARRADARADAVDEGVVREDEVGAAGDEEPAGEAVPAPLERVDLADEDGGVDDHALAEDAGRVGPEDATREEPDDELLVTDDEGVPRVG